MYHVCPVPAPESSKYGGQREFYGAHSEWYIRKNPGHSPVQGAYFSCGGPGPLAPRWRRRCVCHTIKSFQCTRTMMWKYSSDVWRWWSLQKLHTNKKQLFTCKLGWRKPTQSWNRPPTPGILPKWVNRLFFVILWPVEVVW